MARFTLVPPSDYSLTIAAPGFAVYAQKGIVMNANLYATQNVRLGLGPTNATVTVTADAEPISRPLLRH